MSSNVKKRTRAPVEVTEVKRGDDDNQQDTQDTPEESSEPPSDDRPLVPRGSELASMTWKEYFHRSVKELFFSSWLNLLLVFIPFAIVAHFNKWGDGPTFVLALTALIPLAERIAFVTEDLAKYTNDTIGGLMNATMGNVTEIIVSVMALKAGMLRIVQVSLLGSIISNLLLVMGTAFLVGGIQHSSQEFNKKAATTNVAILNLSLISLVVPSVLEQTHDDPQSISVDISRVIGLGMVVAYFLMIFYQLKTHRHLFEGRDEEEAEEHILGLWGATFWLAVIGVAIGALSQILVESIEGAATELGVPILFIGTILLPIVGNAAEHAAAVIFAHKNRMEICLGIAVGSATQIAVFVLPLCIIIGWAIGQPLDLGFHIFETCIILLTVMITAFTLTNGESDWLRGAMLLFAYFFVAAAFYVHKDPTSDGVSSP